MILNVKYNTQFVFYNIVNQIQHNRFLKCLFFIVSVKK